MISSYINTDDVKGYGYQVDDTEDVPVLEKIIPRAARIFDTEAAVPPGYFGKFSPAENAPNEGASPQDFYGEGADSLWLPPYIGPLAVGAVTAPAGYSVPQFAERADRWGRQYLQARYMGVPLDLMEPAGWPLFGTPVTRDGWPVGVPFTITAKWGWAEVPDDVVEAVLELVIAIWRSKDPAFAKVIKLDDQTIIAQALPDRTKRIAAAYAERRAWEVGI